MKRTCLTRSCLLAVTSYIILSQNKTLLNKQTSSEQSKSTHFSFSVSVSLLQKLKRSTELVDTMSDIIKDAWKRYLLQLQLHPLRTKAITSGVLAGCSDLSSQKISGIKKIQFRRLLLIMLYGFAYAAPLSHFYHKLMDYIFKGKKDSTTSAKKVLVEQLTISPWNNIIFMMYYGLVVEGRSWNLVKNKIRNDQPSIQLTAWKFWPLISWINYQYMPLQLRVLFGSFVSSCWGIFLNLKARSTAVKGA